MSETKLFGTDGIRGIANEFPLTPEFITHIGRALGEVLGGDTPKPLAVIGRDTRWSSQTLQNALTTGLLATGATVVDAGVITTPGVAYLARILGAAAGIVISASHNPVEENGIKFFDRHGLKLSDQVEMEIERRLSSSVDLTTFKPLGHYTDGQAFLHKLYVEDLLSEHQDFGLNGLTIVVDCANGSASSFAPQCLTRLGARVISIHASPTGTNINDRAGSEYVRRHPKHMGSLVRQYGANLGLAFDGDADRVVFVDEQDGLIDGDHTLAILARSLDERHKLIAHTLVTTYMRNEGLVRFAQSCQLRVIETTVGDKYVVEKLLDLVRASADSDGIALGGEQAGHIVIMDKQHTTGDGIRTALFLIRTFIESGAKSLIEFRRVIQKTPQVIASAYVGKGPHLDRLALDELEHQLRQNLPALKRINLRYSGTEPLFRVMLEADEEMSEIKLGHVAWNVCRKVQTYAGTIGQFLEILDCVHGGLLGPLDEQEE